MKRISMVALAALTLSGLSATASAGDEGQAAAASAAARLKEVSVDELVKLQSTGSVVVFDAGSAETREKYGVIPAATQLSSSSEYDTAILPADKTQLLVFYCANSSCTASDKAATRAQQAGWTNVAVLRAGIAGWAEAGQVASAASKKP